MLIGQACMISYRERNFLMFDYIDVFKLEAKCFLKDFRKKHQKEVDLAAKYFSGKSNLSLMQAQHIIAKEYGFNSWDDLISVEKWNLAGALNAKQNTRLTSPLKIWYGSDEYNYSTPERFGIKGPAVRDDLDLVNYREVHSHGVSSYLHINNYDVSEADLSGLDVSKATFDDFTIWPQDKSKMPKDFNPQEFMEKRKNPGLGIRQLHKRGIDGRGRNVAIIDASVLRPHLEYRESLADYINLKEGDLSRAQANGGWGVSVMVGKICGIAPKAKLYYFAVDFVNNDYSQYARALDRVCDLHLKLKSLGQKGIDVVVLNNLYGNGDLGEALQRARSLGIFVCMLSYAYSEEQRAQGLKHKTNLLFEFPHAANLTDVECRMYGDIDNSDDYVVHNNRVSDENSLCVVGYGQTVACQYTIGSYLFNATSTLRTFWLGGLYVLAKCVKENLTSEEFFKTAFDTGDYRKGIGVVINPQKLIAELSQ